MAIERDKTYNIDPVVIPPERHPLSKAGYDNRYTPEDAPRQEMPEEVQQNPPQQENVSQPVTNQRVIHANEDQKPPIPKAPQIPQQKRQSMSYTSNAEQRPVGTANSDEYDTYLRGQAKTLADIRRERAERTAQYQKARTDGEKMIKIMALGKLVGALAQFAGNARGAGLPSQDADPYLVNAWKKLDELKNDYDADDKELGNLETSLRETMEKLRAQGALANRKHQNDLDLVGAKNEAAINLSDRQTENAMRRQAQKGLEDRITAGYKGEVQKDVNTHETNNKIRYNAAVVAGRDQNARTRGEEDRKTTDNTYAKKRDYEGYRASLGGSKSSSGSNVNVNVNAGSGSGTSDKSNRGNYYYDEDTDPQRDKLWYSPLRPKNRKIYRWSD